MSFENILVEGGKHYTIITLNRPKANALSRDLMQELRQALETAEAEKNIRVIMITGGEGRFFAAGADISTFGEMREDPLKEGGLFAEGIKTVNAIEACSKPVIAVVNGIALGGGNEICLACHMRIAADTAIFGQPEINLGIIPGWGGTYRLPQMVGESRARDWLLTGRQVTAQEALQAGLVCQVVPKAELMDAAKKLAADLAGKPPVATRETLRILRERMLYPERGQELEARGFEAAMASADAVEGITAFLEKRKPNFTGE